MPVGQERSGGGTKQPRRRKYMPSRSDVAVCPTPRRGNHTGWKHVQTSKTRQEESEAYVLRYDQRRLIHSMRLRGSSLATCVLGWRLDTSRGVPAASCVPEVGVRLVSASAGSTVRLLSSTSACRCTNCRSKESMRSCTRSNPPCRISSSSTAVVSTVVAFAFCSSSIILRPFAAMRQITAVGSNETNQFQACQSHPRGRSTRPSVSTRAASLHVMDSPRLILSTGVVPSDGFVTCLANLRRSSRPLAPPRMASMRVAIASTTSVDVAATSEHAWMWT